MNLKYVAFLILLFISISANVRIYAAVTVTPATGGSSISADDEGVAWTTLTGPIIAESANGEVGTGTIILDAPAGVIFDVGGVAPTVKMDRIGGNGVVTRNINEAVDASSMAITSISTTQITFTVTVASNAGVYCKLTWQNVRVRPNTGAAGTGNITTSGTAAVTGITQGTTNMGTMTVVAGAFVKMQAIFPGETASPGSAGGVTGSPSAQTAGSVVNFTVNAVDANWNVVSSTNTVTITSSDANATLPADAALVAGTKSFSVTLKTAGSKTVTATNFTDPAKTAYTSPAITVNAGSFTKLQLLMPGETASAGSASGKTGTPDAQTAGTSFSVTVNAVDANWNLVNSITDVAGITSSDANATLPANAALVAGTKTYSVTFKTAGTATVTATDITDGAKTANTSPSTTINAGAFTKMQILVPGETASPGSGTGKTGTPNAQNLGTPFSVTVNAVDANWNLVSSTNTIGITSSDVAATLPGNAALVAGTKNFSVTLNTAGGFTVTATNITDGSKTANTSPSISVVLSILTTATGGSSISADTKGGAYTSLTGPAFSEGSSGEVGAGTIILNAPSGVIFDVGGTAPTLLMERVGGAGGDGFNINDLASGSTIALTTITTTQITFTITAASSDGVYCKITFQNVRVRPNNGNAGAGNLLKTGTSVMSGVTNSVTNFGTLTVVAGAFTKMQLLVPGETASPGDGTGKTGSPDAQSAGTAFNVTVNAVDQYWNILSSTNTVGITSSDANATLPANAALVAGTKTFSVILNTVGSKTVTATNITDGTKTANTSPAITVNAGAFAKLQLLLPGETAAPGTASGKTGTPSAQTAGTAFTVTVNAVDAVWNVVSSTNTVGITSTDANATLPANAAMVAGTKDFSITLKTAGSFTITASNITDGTKTANTSPSVTINVGAFTKMQILVPGETASPGSASGKTGTPEAQSSTRAFTVTVNAVDANWNVVSSTNTVGITSSDGLATLPANAALVAGTKTFSVTLNATSGTYTVTATNITDGSKTANTSPAITLVLATWDLATGGSAISADNTGGAYTTLTGPVYTEGVTGDVGTGTIILNAPTGVIFDVAAAPTLLMTRIAGSGADSRNINAISSGSTIALTTITTTQITFTITSASNNGVTCRLTFQNVKVRPNTGAGSSGNLTKTGTSNLVGIYAATNLGTLTVVAGAFTKMQLLVPGETAVPGPGSGKSGTPTDQTAGSSFSVTVNAVDQYWNVVSSTNTVGITSSDANATLPANAALVAGTQTFSVTLKTAGSKTVTATNITDGTKTLNTSPAITVDAGTFSKMQIIVPGETADPGSASGKTGTPSAQTSGTSFSVTVNAVDANWNVVSSTNTIAITSADANATLPADAALVAGTKNFSVTLKTAGAATITATNVTDGTKTANTSPSITINAGAFTKMQIIVPGETLSPGSASGKTGSPSGQTPGTAFTVTVRAVDANWNLVSSTNTVGITSSDGTATLPANAALVGGTKDFSVTLNGTGDFTVTATNITDGTKTANVSPAITCGPVVWNGGAGTANWGDAANWSPVGVPTATNNVNLTGASNIEINVAAVCNNITLNNAGLTLTILAGNSLAVSGTFTLTNGTLATKAAFPTVTGAITISDGTTINYNGTGAQTIENSITYSKLKVDNATGPVTVEAGADIVVANTLNMTAGNIDLNSRTLQLGNAAVATLLHGGATTTLYNGTFKRYLTTGTEISSSAAPLYGLFPIGTSTAYRPVTINATAGNAPTTAGYLSASHTHNTTFDVTYTDNDGDAIERISRAKSTLTSTSLVGGSYDITMTMTSLGTSNTLTDLKLVTYTSDVMGSPGGTFVATAGTSSSPVVKRNGLTLAQLAGPTAFVVGTKSRSSSPLPIELIAFDAVVNEDKVDITWTTSGEINNDYFSIEKSKNGIDFEFVTNIAGAGNSTNVLDYSTVDYNPYKGISYYRLKQTDYNGQFTYSNLVAVEYKGDENSFNFNAFPNPNNGEQCYVNLPDGLGKEIKITVYNINGTEAYSNEIITSNEYSNVSTIDFAKKLNPGIYFITITYDQETCKQRIIIY